MRSIKLDINNIEGQIAKLDDKYKVKDNTVLNTLVVSSTTLNPFKSTTGHKHEGQEEVYYFVRGQGTIYLDNAPIDVEPGTLVLIEDGVHHRVEAHDDELYFICVFNGHRYDKMEEAGDSVRHAPRPPMSPFGDR